MNKGTHQAFHSENKKHIVIVGGGVAGLTCAYYLSEQFRVTLLEAGPYIGGHTNTVSVVGSDCHRYNIDTGFIVLNDKNYPLFSQLLSDVGVEHQASDMSFGVYSRPDRLVYGSDFPWGLFAQKSNLLKPSFIKMLLDIRRFNRQTLKDLELNKIPASQSLGGYLEYYGYSKDLIHQYIVPMSAAIWSTSESEVAEYPALAFFNFWKNHGLLYHGLPEEKHNPKWKTVKGGSQTYVKAILDKASFERVTDSPVTRIDRHPDRVSIQYEGGSIDADKVIIATHADQALRLVSAPTEEETSLLSAWRYSKNKTILHSDERIMPPQRDAWCSWNIYRDQKTSWKSPVTVTYYMNRLQSLSTKQSFLVTLNPPFPLKNIHYETDYTHPIYTKESIETQEKLPLLNGVNNTYYCGSYFGYGFHEDAVRSAHDVIKKVKEGQ